MADRYKVRIKLIENMRPCNQGHKIGTEWLYDNAAPKGLCSFAFNALRPFIEVLATGGTLPWEKDPNGFIQACPDHLVNNSFELRREPESDKRAGFYDISVKMVGKECEGACSFGHKEGDTWDLKSPREMIPENICPSAWKAISDAVIVMRYGGQYPWQSDPDVYTITCPDPNVRNKFEISRTLRKQ